MIFYVFFGCGVVLFDGLGFDSCIKFWSLWWIIDLCASLNKFCVDEKGFFFFLPLCFLNLTKCIVWESCVLAFACYWESHKGVSVSVAFSFCLCHFCLFAVKLWYGGNLHSSVCWSISVKVVILLIHEWWDSFEH